MSVVLDGVARDREVAGTRAVAAQPGVRSAVVMTTCEDEAEHRARIENRDRGIPGWHELTWDDVRRTRARWQTPQDMDVVMDSLTAVGRAVERTLALVASPHAGGR